MLGTDVLQSTKQYDATDLHVDIDLVDVMLDLDPGMLVWAPQLTSSVSDAVAVDALR